MSTPPPDPLAPSDPPVTSAPLHPPGRKRWDPRAPYGTAPGGGPPPPTPPIIVEGGSEGGIPPTAGTGGPGTGTPGSPPGTAPGTPYPTCPDNGLALLQNHVTFSGTSLPYATIKISMAAPGPRVGQQIGSTQADAAGAWTVQLVRSFPDGFYCVTATQTVHGFTTSAPSAPYCFNVGICVGAQPPIPPPTQTIQFLHDGLRYRWQLPGSDEWLHGTLAYKFGDEWVYGVLKKAVV